MNSNYILPVSIAAAVHGALLFGFSKSPRMPVVESRLPPVCVFEFDLKDPEAVEFVESGGEEAAPKEALVAPPPMQPEHFAPRVEGEFEIMKPRIEPWVPGDVVNVIPVGFREGSGPGSGNDPILPVHLDNSPRTRFQPAPHYPPAGRSAGLAGEVMVEFTVDESGRVIEPRVVSSSDRIFEEPTLRAVAKWQFEPGRRHGRIVRFRMAVPVVFNLNE